MSEQMSQRELKKYYRNQRKINVKEKPEFNNLIQILLIISLFLFVLIIALGKISTIILYSKDSVIYTVPSGKISIKEGNFSANNIFYLVITILSLAYTIWIYDRWRKTKTFNIMFVFITIIFNVVYGAWFLYNLHSSVIDIQDKIQFYKNVFSNNISKYENIFSFFNCFISISVISGFFLLTTISLIMIYYWKKNQTK
ncbi:MAG: hypothetical protein K4H23_04570 [Mollicutes bacterium PWAP]|nr:hypothetical protein [Mollicutes bacterium PWAP]